MQANLKPRILIIGGGVIASILSNYLSRKGLNHHVSIGCVDAPVNLNFMGSKLPYYASGIGGLGRYWHSVVDLAELTDPHPEVCNIFGFDRRKSGQHAEFVPYFAYRPILRSTDTCNLIFSEAETIEQLSPPKVRFSDGSSLEFDNVFVCHGALPRLDCLTNSGLASRSVFLSDHLVVSTKKVIRAQRSVVSRSIRGHYRNYEVRSIAGIEAKITKRPTYSSKIIALTDKSLYTKPAGNIITSIYKTMSPRIALQALNLRYGILGSNWQQICLQVPVNGLYRISPSGYELNNGVYEKALEPLREDFEIDFASSAIHFFNTYSTLSKEVKNFEVPKNGGISLFTPQYEYRPRCHHFTASMANHALYALDKYLEAI